MRSHTVWVSCRGTVDRDGGDGWGGHGRPRITTRRHVIRKPTARVVVGLCDWHAEVHDVGGIRYNGFNEHATLQYNAIKSASRRFGKHARSRRSNNFPVSHCIAQCRRLNHLL